ncbi:MAG: DNA translocase FtsK, partial [Sedimentisphaerales bacterium]|nr:DNA translocase FtsK [Sedimentisphaerales bacterium]
MADTKVLNRVAFTSIALGICLFVLVSLVSFSTADWPNPDVVTSGPAQNLCGPAGAWISYQLHYWFGPASYVFLIAVIVYLIAFCANKSVEQLSLRAIGVLLVGAVTAATAHLWRPGDENSLTIGNGGVLGAAAGHFLLTNTALVGAILILLAAMVVGSLLAADNLLAPMFILLWRGLERLRHVGPVLATVGAGVARIPRWNPLARPSSATATLKPPISSRPGSGLVDDDDIPGLNEKTDLFTSLDKDDSDSGDINANAKNKKNVKSSTSATSPITSALAGIMGRKPRQASSPPAPDYSDYRYPSLSLLRDPEPCYVALQEKVVRQKSDILERTLKEFNLDARVVEAETGPAITMFELQLAPGIKVARITNLANDIARALGAGAVRVVAPIPGKHTIGIEAPNNEKEKVRVKELMTASGSKASKMNIPLFLGKDGSGEALVCDLTKMPHLLIAGTTGSGKSVCINAIIMSILLTQRPDLVKLILVDPKMVEMNAFRDVPHLMCPIVTEMSRAEKILEWLTTKMDERYAILAEARVRNITDYNKLSPEEIYDRFQPSNDEEKAKIPLRLPYMVIVIDELADLMMTSAKEVESYIIRIAQKSRAIGIHIVLATQRPQATVVTGLIKSNLPCRISFRVAARMDSRIVLDQNGAETLLGQGDMLFLQPGTSELIRAQGAFLDDEEIHNVVKYLKETAAPSFHPELMQMNRLDTGDMERDELFDEAVKIILETKRGSVSLLQRRLTIGYSRASRLIDQMATAGIVGEYKGSQAREVLITLDEYDVIKTHMDRDAAEGYADLAEADAESITAEVPGAGSTHVGAPAIRPELAENFQTKSSSLVEETSEDTEDISDEKENISEDEQIILDEDEYDEDEEEIEDENDEVLDDESENQEEEEE